MIEHIARNRWEHLERRPIPFVVDGDTDAQFAESWAGLLDKAERGEPAIHYV